MDVAEIKDKLVSTKSKDRRRAATAIGKAELTDMSDELYQAYLRERKDKRTWETQAEMIKSLGLLNYKQALKDVDSIVRLNIPHDRITSVAAMTYVRLKRQSMNDAQPVLELLRFGGVSVIEGALMPLAIDQMVPPNDEIDEILSVCRDVNKHKDRVGWEYGLIDSRIYLAIACSNWGNERTVNFLQHCIETAYNIDRFGKPVLNANLIAVCENSLKGKYSKNYLS